jgi:AraC-like DNA-binding protein
LSFRDGKFASGDRAKGLPPQVRSALLTAYTEAAKSVGLDPYSMLRKSGLPREALDQADLKIPAEKVQALVDESAQVSQCEAFGLLVGHAFTLPMLGALGLLLREQPTVRDAIAALVKYAGYQDSALLARLEEHEGEGLLELSVAGPRRQANPRAAHMAVAMYVQLLRGVLGETWKPARVVFASPAPHDTTPFEQLLGPAEFGQTLNGVILARSDLDLPLANANADVARELSRYLDRSALARAASLTETVGELIERLLPRGECNIERVAQHLGVDRRTIHRRLLQEGRSFTDLVHDTRRELVARELAPAGEPLRAIAARLGFSSLSTFSRWFRRTYGVPASQFRHGGETDQEP